VDALVVWSYPRSPQEKVPASVAEVDIKAPHVARRVTDAAQVHRIVAWFDALPVIPPDVASLCGPSDNGDVEFTFRSANGSRLASAAASTFGKARYCDPIGFSIRGKLQTPLVDKYGGPGFVYRVQRLVGVTLLEKQ
jgi:hypothetical protein